LLELQVEVVERGSGGRRGVRDIAGEGEDGEVAGTEHATQGSRADRAAASIGGDAVVGGVYADTL
jgi:hypothetical protein